MSTTDGPILIELYIQMTVAILAMLGVVTGLWRTRAMPPVVPAIASRIDKLRGAFLAILCFSSVTLLTLGLTGLASIAPKETLAASLWFFTVVLLFSWRAREISRDVKETVFVKIWWLLAAASRGALISVELAGSNHIRVVPLVACIADAALCLVLFAAYNVPAQRFAARDALLAHGHADVEAELGGNVAWDRTLSQRPASPETTIGFLGFMAFSWFTPMVDLAYRRDREAGRLEPTDVYPLRDKDLPRRQLDNMNIEWEIERRKETPSLGSALTRCYGIEVAKTAWYKLINDVCTFVGPFLLNRILNFVEQRTEDDRIGYLYAVGMVAASGCQALAMAHYFQRGYRNGMCLRASLILLAYSKALRVLPWPTPPPADEQPAAPTTADGHRRRCCRPRPAAPQTRPAVGGMGQMTNLISSDTDKFTFLMPYFNLFWSAPLQLIICFIMLFAYVSWALLSGIAVMFVCVYLSNLVQKRATKVQRLAMEAKDERLKLEVEVLKIMKIIKVYAWEDTIEDHVKQLRNKELRLQLRYKLWAMGIFLTFSLSPALVSLATFGTYSFILNKRLTAATAFTSLSLFNILTFPLGAMPMMARFFMEARVAKDRLQAFFLAPEVAARPPPPPKAKVEVMLRASHLKWPDGTELLQDIDVEVQRGEFVAVFGRTGAGKSGLLYALLGELPMDEASGKAYLGGSVGYCAQSAWIRNATVRDNITGGERDRNLERYESVVDACALRQDLELLPDGDLTAVGDRGINLSGGQKQRIALARAAYANPDVFILDDVLSALDAHVTSHVCSQLLRGPLMKGKTIILVTHSQKALPLADRIMLLGDQKVKFSGTFDELCKSGLVENLEGQSFQENGDGDNGEKGKTGEAGATSVKDNGAVASPKPQKPPAPRQEERSSGAVGFPVYCAYVAACGGCLPVGVFFLSVVIAESSKNLSDIWLSQWTNSGGATSGAGIYALTSLVSVAAGLCYAVTRVIVGQKGSRSLHEACLRALLRAQMTFFDLTPNGEILNRLAEDTNILDYNLPQTLAANCVWVWRSAAIVVICMNVAWYLMFLILPMFGLYYRVARRYLPATRDLRRLDASARSPIFSHFSETMAGVSTIRAMQQQQLQLAVNVSKLESQMEAFYLSNTSARWLSLRLQVNGTVLVGSICILGIALSTNGKLSAGMVGLAITYAMKLTDTLNQVNREFADRETQMVSVERLHKYTTDIQSEAELRIPGIPQNDQTWLDKGHIAVEGMTVRYRDDLPIVLDGVSLDIKPGERVGVVGRTGCGKSSFLSALLRIVELQGGRVLMDGVDTQTVGLHSLREKAAIIPQDPAILTGSVRFNLDPFAQKSDEELWTVLDRAQLRKRVESAQGGLDSKVEEGGGNFSVGELQLLCLARALLRRKEAGGLLLLDEATSALDAETDAIIQQVIRSDFKCTTITIAHRIQTLLDYDRIALLNAGKLVEFDTPDALLNRPSTFQALAAEAGITAEY